MQLQVGYPKGLPKGRVYYLFVFKVISNKIKIKSMDKSKYKEKKIKINRKNIIKTNNVINNLMNIS